jgi:hypothetical protein
MGLLFYYVLFMRYNLQIVHLSLPDSVIYLPVHPAQRQRVDVMSSEGGGGSIVGNLTVAMNRAFAMGPLAHAGMVKRPIFADSLHDAFV